MTRLRHALSMLLIVLGSPLAAQSQDVRLEQPRPDLIQLSGGSGPAAWHVRYGVALGIGVPPQLVPVSTTRAYFTHGPWLRLLDTTNGTVLGRWRFPQLIESVDVTGAGPARVRFKGPPPTGSLTVPFDPADPNVPVWDNGGLISLRVSESEASHLMLASAAPDSSVKDPWKMRIPTAARAVAEFEDLVRRDPSAPWLRVGLAKLQLDANDSRAAQSLEDALSVPSPDFTEWFRIAGIMDQAPGIDPKFVVRAFSLAMTAFLKRDRDPRLVDTIIARLILFPAGANMATFSDEARRRFFERMYLVSPTSEATERAWAFYADELERKSLPDAAVWRERAATSSRESQFLATIDIQRARDRFLLLELASILAAVIWIVSRQIKYAPQRRMHAIAASRAKQFKFSVGQAYWSRRDRWSLLAIALVGWLAAGPAFVYGLLITRTFGLPVHVGMLNGFENLEESSPQSDERALLHAIALQQSNKAVEAERLYRALPQFAESWNNLGVILARAGKTDESRQAFARALEVDPSLPEAVLNASGKPTSEVTRTFQTYAPDAKMIALPARDRMMRGYFGSEWSRRYLLMLLGPTSVLRVLGTMDFQPVIIAPAVIGGGFLTLLLIVSIIMVAFVPTVDVTVAPGRLTYFIEMLVPGTSPVWRGGAAVVLAWSTLVLAVVFQWLFTTPYLTIAVFQAGIMRAFGYDTGLADVNPPMAGLVAFILTVSVINVLVDRRRT